MENINSEFQRKQTAFGFRLRGDICYVWFGATRTDHVPPCSEHFFSARTFLSLVVEHFFPLRWNFFVVPSSWGNNIISRRKERASLDRNPIGYGITRTGMMSI